MGTEFDYIIAGAGSPGCVLANRLGAGGCHKVLLLEEGPKDNYVWIHASENGRGSGRNETQPHNPNAQTCLSNASEYFSTVPEDGLGDLQQKLSLSDRTSAGVSHG